MKPKKEINSKWHCWICEKAKINNLSQEFHEFVMGREKLISGYWLAFKSVCDFLIGEKKNSILYDMYTSSNYNGDPRDYALDVLSKCGLNK